MSHALGGAVFRSCATQDALAARRLRDTLQAAGIEAWLDETGLDGGEGAAAFAGRIKGLLTQAEVPEVAHGHERPALLPASIAIKQAP